jgi:hypothetical protein
VAGDYSGSSALFSEYIALADKLDQLEQEESVEYKARRAEAEEELATNATFDAQRGMYEPEESGRKRKSRRPRADSAAEEAAPASIMVPLPSPERYATGELVYESAALEPEVEPGLLGAPAEADSIAAIFDASNDPLAEAAGAYSGRDLLEEAAAKGDDLGSGGLGVRGAGIGGGGASGAGLGGLGTKGRGSGASGYGSGEGRLGSSEGLATASQERTVEAREIEVVTQGTAGVSVTRGRAGRKKAESAPRPRPSPRSMPSAPASPPPPPLEDFEAEPMEDVWVEDAVDEIAEVQVVQRSRRLSVSKKAKSVAPSPVYEPDTIELFGEEPEAPEVTATSLSIVVPNLGGETVLYQTLLLDPGEAHYLLVRARNPKKNP